MFKPRATSKLIEILLILAAFAVLLGIVLLALNPTENMFEERNEQRRADLSIILNAVTQYSRENGALTLSNDMTEICKAKANCSGLIDLSVLTQNKKYLVEIPVDPSGASENGTGYEISESEDGVVIVAAPNAENGEIIKVTR